VSYALDAGTERDLLALLAGDGDEPGDGATDGFGDGFGDSGADELADAAGDWAGEGTSDGSGDGATDLRLVGLAAMLAARVLPGTGVTLAVESAAEVAVSLSLVSEPCAGILVADCLSACPVFLAPVVVVEEVVGRGQSCAEHGMMTAGWLSALPVAAKITAPAATMISTAGTTTPRRWNRLLGRL
jgi:hypothetical protein